VIEQQRYPLDSLRWEIQKAGEKRDEAGVNLSRRAFQVGQSKYVVATGEWHHVSTMMVMVEGPCSTNDDLCHQIRVSHQKKQEEVHPILVAYSTREKANHPNHESC